LYKDYHGAGGLNLLAVLRAGLVFEYDGSLFCGHDSGTFIVKNGTSKKYISKSGTWKFKTVPNQKGFFASRNTGISVLEKVNNQWRYRNKISGLIIQHDISKLRMLLKYMLVMNIKAF
jgi:hypothetical protein